MQGKYLQIFLRRIIPWQSHIVDIWNRIIRYRTSIADGVHAVCIEVGSADHVRGVINELWPEGRSPSVAYHL